MCVWCGKSGYDLGIGKSEYSIRSREVLMCSERYDDDMPLVFLNTQLPPTRSDASKQSKSNPAVWSAFAAAIPDEPAPITQTRGSVDIPAGCHEGDASVKFCACEDPRPWRQIPTARTSRPPEASSCGA